MNDLWFLALMFIALFPWLFATYTVLQMHNRSAKWKREVIVDNDTNMLEEIRSWGNESQQRGKNSDS